ncbi:MAG TPA: twin-arginine translocase TatA/TatE family subunit [Acidimicrobiales bacterium]|jgi:sec-independent protein translocase protein TatB|nr:twin-arginine translocase TatA/TatE family subunit [Acidimicrobiales bacterium]
MFNLDPGKLLVIAVVAIILLGPDKLPQFARQVGGAWRTFNDFRHRMESEVRSTMPDLPPTSEIARLARSPSALLTHLSKLPPEDDASDGSVQPPVAGDVAAAAANGAGAAGASVTGRVDTAGESEDAGVAADSGSPETAPAATNGKPEVAPQPSDIAVPADPTLN